MKKSYILRVMRLLVLFLLAGFMHVSAAGYAQNITLTGKNIPFVEALGAIRTQGGYAVTADKTLLKRAKPVTVQANAMPVEQFLAVILTNQPLEASIEGKTIIVKEKKISGISSRDVAPVVPMQHRVVTGRITNHLGEPFPGVNVRLKGTSSVAITDVQGRYSIAVRDTYDVLIFSFMGFDTVERRVGQTAEIDVMIQEKKDELSEVVVIGYGEVQRKDLTGSVGVVAVSDMAKAPVGSFAEALAGRVSGVQVNESDGQPGGPINITIRGIGSLTQSTTPLFVIDGFPVEDPDPVLLNPEEIKSMTVLKDASSTAIYGSRGANGVVLIETKRGQAGRPVISLNSSIGYQQVAKPLQLMSPYEFIRYQQELSPTSATTNAFFAYNKELGRVKTLEDYKDVPGVNFQDEVLRTGKVGIYDLALRGGNGNTTYSVSGSAYKQDGVILNTGLTRYSGRLTLDQVINNRLKVGATVNYSDALQGGQVINQGTTTFANPMAFILSRAWIYRPISPDPDDNLLEDIVDNELFNVNDFKLNPRVDLENQHQFNNTNLVETNGYLDLKITDHLRLNVRGGLRHNRLFLERFNNSLTSQGRPSPANLNGVNGFVRNTLMKGISNENTIHYRRIFNNDHTVTGLGLFSVNTLITEIHGYGGRLLPNENLGINGLDEGVLFNGVSSSSKNALLSYATRWDYSYKSKYIVTATFRADGSSKFINNRWGYFPGTAIAWNMHQEEFFQSLKPFVSSSKLRVSYGSNGNNRVGDFDIYTRLLQTTNGYSFNNAIPTGAIHVSAVGNTDLRWEKVNTLDFGVELGFLNDRVSVEADLYRKISDNLLLNATLPPSTGYASGFKNIGSLSNEGLEITLKSVIFNKGPFSWESSFNISFNRNKVLKLTEGQHVLPSNVLGYSSQFNSRPLYMSEIGQPAGMMVGFLWEGNYQFNDFEETAPGVYVLKPEVPSNGMARTAIRPGDIKYRDINGDGAITDLDLAVIGRGHPVHFGGFSNNFIYKGVSLNLFFQWSYGNDIYNANRLLMEGNSNNWANINQLASYANRWTADNQTNENFRAGGGGVIGFHSSRVIENGSYLRLKTMALSYAVPARFLERVFVSNLALHIAAQNLFTWTKYSGMDPEVSVRGNVLTPGYDFSAYPKTPTVTFGLKASF